MQPIIQYSVWGIGVAFSNAQVGPRFEDGWVKPPRTSEGLVPHSCYYAYLTMIYAVCIGRTGYKVQVGDDYACVTIAFGIL